MVPVRSINRSQSNTQTAFLVRSHSRIIVTSGLAQAYLQPKRTDQRGQRGRYHKSAVILWTLSLPLGHIALLSFRDRSKTRIETALYYANGSWQTCAIVALTTVNFGYVRQDRSKMSIPRWEDCLAAQARAPAGDAVRSRPDRQAVVLLTPSSSSCEKET